MFEAWSLAVALACGPAGSDGPAALREQAVVESLVAAPLRVAAGLPAPGSSRHGVVHAGLLEPVWCSLC